MSEYKLKKWYPSLPQGYREGITTVKTFKNTREIYYPMDGRSGVPASEVEDNPEFWEKINERKFEIIAYKYDGKVYHKKDGKDAYFPNRNGKGYQQWFLERSVNSEIYSIKRLSDGEVFTIGDKVEHWVSSISGHYKWSINSFGLKDNKLLAYSRTGFHMELSEISKREKPLFTTEDGVDIYEGDSFYGVRSDFSIITDTAPTIFEYTKKFNSVDQAEGYVEEHTPKYSKADIKEVFRSSVFSNDYSDLLIACLENKYV